MSYCHNNTRTRNENSSKFNVTPGREKGGEHNTMDTRIATKILGTTRNACSREIKLKYRLLARKYHPDKWVKEYVFSKERSRRLF